MSKFSIRLRELRQSHSLSLQKLADAVGMSKSSINMYERDEREPGLDTLEAIADFFNVDLDYLLGKTDIPRKTLIHSTSNNDISEDDFAYALYNETKELTKEQKSMILSMAKSFKERLEKDGKL